MAPLRRIGLSDPSTPVAKRRSSERRQSRLAKLWRSRQEAPGQALTRSLTQIAGEDIERLVTAAGTNSFEKLAEKLKVVFGDDVQIDRAYDEDPHRITFKNIKVTPGTKEFAALDFRGLEQNVALRFRNCEMDVLDLSFAKLHSIDLRGCGPSSPQHYHGMQIFADNLQLAADFYIDRTDKPSRILTLQAPGMKAREVQLLSGTEFNGGLLAREIWEQLLERLKMMDYSTKHDLDVAGVIETHAIAARHVLKTLDLRSSEIDTVFISIQSRGIVDLHDAHIKRKLLIEAGIDGRCHKVDFAHGFQDLTGLREIRCRHTGEHDSAANFLHEVWHHLNGPLSPSLDLAGIKCDGELRFDGYDDDGNGSRKQDSQKPNDPPVTGHVNLVNAKCRIFTDDESWWDYKDCRITFELNCFEYEFFGISSRFLFDTDPALRPFHSERWEDSPNTAEVDSECIRKKDLGGSYWNSAARICRLDTKFEPKNKAAWLNRNLLNYPPADVPNDLLRHLGLHKKENLRKFDAQPWTQCARALRRAGWREAAEAILLERENQIHRLESWREGLASLFLFLAILSGIISAVSFADGLYNWGSLLVVLTLVFVIGLVFTQKSNSAPRKLWYKMLSVTIGYGYRPTRALWQSTFLVVLGSVLFYCANKNDLLIPEPEKRAEVVAPSQSESAAHNQRILVRPAPVALGSAALTFASPSYLRLASATDHRDCKGEDREECTKHPLQPGPGGAFPKRAPATDDQSEIIDADRSVGEQSVVAESLGKLDDSIGALAQAVSRLERHLADASGKPHTDVHFNAFMYTLDVFIPLVDLGQANYWLPGHAVEGVADKNKGAYAFGVWVFYWFLICAGWWFTSVIVASLTGFLDRKE